MSARRFQSVCSSDLCAEYALLWPFLLWGLSLSDFRSLALQAWSKKSFFCAGIVFAFGGFGGQARARRRDLRCAVDHVGVVAD